MSSADLISSLNHLLPLVAGIRDTKLLKYIEDAGTDDFNLLLLSAAHAGDRDKIEFALNKGADNLHAAVKLAVSAEHSDIAKYLFDLIRQKSEDSQRCWLGGV